MDSRFIFYTSIFGGCEIFSVELNLELAEYTPKQIGACNSALVLYEYTEDTVHISASF